MDRSKNIVIWVAAFAGVMLVYSAYKNKSPLTLATTALTTTPTVASSNSTIGATTSSSLTPLVQDGNAYDANGVMIGPVPPPYASNPNSYIPGNADKPI